MIQYGTGWYPEERDDVAAFRWTEPEASFRVDVPSAPKPGYLRIVAGHGFAAADPLILEVFANGRSLGRRRINPSFSAYAFPLAESGETEFCLRLNQTLRVDGEARELGLMIRSIEVLSPPDVDTFLEGWYPPEADGSRWMMPEARCFFGGLPEAETAYLRLVAGHPIPGATPRLTVLADGNPKAELEIPCGDQEYWIPIGSGSPFRDLEFRVDRELETGDPRDERRLGMLVRKAEVLVPGAQAPLYAKGFLGWEEGDLAACSWIGREASVYLARATLESFPYAIVHASSEFANLTQIFSVFLNGQRLADIPLLFGWNAYSVHLPGEPPAPGAPVEMTFAVNKLFPASYHPGDARDLGVRIGRMEFSNEGELHREMAFFYDNAVKNYKEMQEGKTILDSYPTNLGIDLYAKCNIEPHCVYCLWDRMKIMEGEWTAAVVDEKTLRGYGPFFLSARTLVNCSFGEPLLHPRLEAILELCERNRKLLEMSTNGQAFTPRTIGALAGKRVTLYVSLDAASRETYAKIRNDRWDEILRNLVLLNEERKQKGNLPKIFMVFMPMKVNRDELEEYFRLCRRIDADSLVLRSLIYLWNPQIREERGGYLFDYKEEFLSRKELEAIARRCGELSKKYGIPVANQLNFGTTQAPRSSKSRTPGGSA